MAFSLIPDGVYQSVFHLDREELKARGITLILADLDNTLARYGQRQPDEQLIAWVRVLREEGFELFILSNSRKPTRARDFAAALDVPFLNRAGKPGTAGFCAALERMGRKPEQAVMVGDQIFTDVLGAKRAGVRVYLVEPIRLSGNPGRYVRYGVETPFRALGRKRGGR